MGWSSRENNLRRDNKPTPSSSPISPKPVENTIKPVPTNLEKLDLSDLD